MQSLSETGSIMMSTDSKKLSATETVQVSLRKFFFFFTSFYRLLSGLITQILNSPRVTRYIQRRERREIYGKKMIRRLFSFITQPSCHSLGRRSEKENTEKFIYPLRKTGTSKEGERAGTNNRIFHFSFSLSLNDSFHLCLLLVCFVCTFADALTRLVHKNVMNFSERILFSSAIVVVCARVFSLLSFYFHSIESKSVQSQDGKQNKSSVSR